MPSDCRGSPRRAFGARVPARVAELAATLSRSDAQQGPSAAFPRDPSGRGVHRSDHGPVRSVGHGDLRREQTGPVCRLERGRLCRGLASWEPGQIVGPPARRHGRRRPAGTRCRRRWPCTFWPRLALSRPIWQVMRADLRHRNCRGEHSGGTWCGSSWPLGASGGAYSAGWPGCEQIVGDGSRLKCPGS